jgi:hypothetical protein
MKIKEQKKRKIEKFKNNQSFKPTYLNNPNKLAKYRNDLSNKNKMNVNAFTYPNSIQTNQFRTIPNQQIMSKSNLNLNIRSDKFEDQIKSEIFDPELEQIFNKIEKEKSYQNILTKTNTTTQVKQAKSSVKFNPIVQNPETKYKLYHESLFRTNPAKKLIDSNKPYIDQTISQNIMSYMNDGIETIYPDNLDVNNIVIDNYNEINHSANKTDPTNEINLNIKKMRGKTIKDIYDEITNDGRMNLQQNLDDLEANDTGTQFIIGEKYGATRFDTYSVR